VPYFHKRKSFAHEQELRAIINPFDQDEVESSFKDKNLRTLPIKIDPSKLIHSIYISPKSQEWFGELVGKIIKRYSLNISIEKSKIYNRPTF
jgi:hypothetical protein